MSRIGNLPVKLTPGVTVTVSDDNTVTVKGPGGELHQKVNPDLKITVENDEVTVSRPTEQKRHKAMHGLYRSLIGNMVTGVTKGYKIELEVAGVGFKADANGQVLELHVGYSHDIYFQIPDEVKVEARTERRSNPVITLTSADKQLIGQVAAKIRSFRKPEPYKGKGIKFVDEQLRKKAGKSAATK
ncbi:MAG: 50S ribosomal protein L6 [Bacteroidales bacterium]|nr:50S ribosomal protein L6 [Bacteroidales bacterium]